MEDLFLALELDYQNNQRRSARGLRWRLAPLRAAFGEDRAIDVTEVRIERYKADRLGSRTRTRYGVGKHSVSPATVKSRARRARPRFPSRGSSEASEHLADDRATQGDRPRQGFLEPAAFDRVVATLPADLQDVARFAYLSGWRGRVRSQTLGWPDIDRGAGRIVLRREHSKNGEPRVLPLMGELATLIERRWTAREYQTAGGRRRSRRSSSTATASRSATSARRGSQPARSRGVSRTLFHDLRRSAVRNMDRAGVARPSRWRSAVTRRPASTVATGSSTRTTSEML